MYLVTECIIIPAIREAKIRNAWVFHAPLITACAFQNAEKWKTFLERKKLALISMGSR